MGGAGDDRGWDGWMASPTQWTWVWVNSWSWWWTRRPGVLQSMGSQRIRHDWAELNHRRCQPHLLHFIGICPWTSLKVFSKQHSMWWIIVWGDLTLRVAFLWEILGGWHKVFAAPLYHEMATHSSTLTWKIPWTEEPGRLQSMGSQSQTQLSNFTSQLHCISPPPTAAGCYL